MMKSEILHACAMSADEFGIVIKGPSGSGKSSLMFGLVERLCRAGISASIVSDDYTEFTEKDGQLVCAARPQMRGKAEVRGFGITETSFASFVAPRLVVELVSDEKIERMPEPGTTCILGQELPLVKVPRRHEEAACRIVICWLRAEANLPLPMPCP